MEFKGIVPAMATPMNEDESINGQEIKKAVERQLSAGVDGIFCLGTNGDNYCLNYDEKLTVIEAIVKAVNGRVPVYAGTGCVTTKETIALSCDAVRVGCDVCAVVTPYFGSCTQQGLYEHYKAVAQAVDAPIIVYNIPCCTGNNVDRTTMERLSHIDNIVGAKDTSGDFDNMLRYIEDTENFSVFAGNDSLILWNLEAGGVGGITGVANLFPQTMVAIYQNWKNGDFEKAKRIQDSIRPITDCFKLGTPNSIMKRLARLMGFNFGPARAPFELHDDNIDRLLQNALDEYQARKVTL